MKNEKSFSLVSLILPILLIILTVVSPAYSTPRSKVKKSPVQKEKTWAQVYKENNPAAGTLLISMEADLSADALKFKKGQEVRINDVRNNFLFKAYVESEPTADNRITFTSSGSGWFFDEDEPFLATCYHVVDILKEKKMNVILFPSFEIKEVSVDVKIEYLDNNNYRHTTTVLGVDEYADVACLKVDIDKKDYSVAKMSKREVKIADDVCAIGSPQGVPQTLTKGIISYNGRLVGLHPVEYSIQTDCPLNPGNSGGPVFDRWGEVVGMCHAGMDGSDGISWLIPISLMKLDEMKKGKDISLPIWVSRP